MELNLKDKVVIVTGGTSGIGKAAALEFAREGCRLAICGRSPEKLEKAKAELEALGAQVLAQSLDVADLTALRGFIDAAAEKYGQIDVLLNNAGTNRLRRLWEVTEEDWDLIHNTDLKAVFFGSQHAAEYMRKAKSGVIINIASLAVRFPSGNRAPYGAAKGGVANLTQTMAAELAPFGIRAVCVLPGSIETELTKDRLHAENETAVRPIALGRIGKPEDLAKPIVFLASDAAGYITGVYIEISGGKHCVSEPWKSWKLD
jgi:NAD(P)-dependent dehydrogenase (short-subunit alcohol dehydrogenase family)